MHPEIARALAYARLADLRRVHHRPRVRRRDARRRVGWFLIDLGLRIATPRPAA